MTALMAVSLGSRAIREFPSLRGESQLVADYRVEVRQLSHECLDPLQLFTGKRVVDEINGFVPVLLAGAVIE